MNALLAMLPLLARLPLRRLLPLLRLLPLRRLLPLPLRTIKSRSGRNATSPAPTPPPPPSFHCSWRPCHHQGGRGGASGCKAGGVEWGGWEREQRSQPQ